MNTKPIPLVVLPSELSDEAAAHFLDFLYQTLRAFENTYAERIERYHQTPDPRQRELWTESDPPF
jgi:hypothetical protein